MKSDYIGFRIPQQDKDGLAQFARDNATTSSQVIRYLIKQLLKGEQRNGVQSISKIDELTREVREHNNFARRVPVLEEKVNQLEKHNATTT